MQAAPEDLRLIDKIDAHVHVHAAQTLHLEQAAEDNFQLISINTDIPTFPPLAEQERLALLHRRHFPGRIFHLASFGVEDWQESGWTNRTIARLEQALERGAIGVKTWKKHIHNLWVQDWLFLTTDHTLTSEAMAGSFRGLRLPKKVIQKIYRENAETWYPRMNQ